MALTTVPAGVLAHGIGGRSDLPIPFALALAASAFVLVVSFVLLAVLWPRSVLHGATAGRPLPQPVTRMLGSAALRWTLRLVGLVLFGWVALAAVLGIDDALNPTAGVVYVLFWVGTLAFASALLGPVWRWLNPVRTLWLLACTALRRDPREGLLPYPDGLGHWPAAVGLLAFGWLELVAPDRDTLGVLRTFFVLYFGFMAIGGVVYGSRWFDRADGFQVASQLYGRISPLGRRADGAWVLRDPLDGLAATPVHPGLPAVVCVLLGATVYDAGSNSTQWVRFVQSGTLDRTLAGTLGLVAAVLLVLGLYLLAVALAGRLSGGDVPQPWLPGLFAHSLVPIAFGYVLAHYWSLWVLTGSTTVQHLADPLGTGANWLGLASFHLPYAWVTPTFVASLQVLAIVVGHVVGVVLAHDKAVSLFPRRGAVVGQIPLLCLMVLYTVSGLLLLFTA